jgi:Transposase IS66 family
VSARLSGAELAAYRQEHAGPVLKSFAEWLAEEAPRVLPKSKIGEAREKAKNGETPRAHALGGAR